MSKLKPCPFCGGLIIFLTRNAVGTLRWAECKDCKTEGPPGQSWDEAKELWNMRQTND